jgi:hypothetical protein
MRESPIQCQSKFNGSHARAYGREADRQTRTKHILLWHDGATTWKSRAARVRGKENHEESSVRTGRRMNESLLPMMDRLSVTHFSLPSHKISTWPCCMLSNSVPGTGTSNGRPMPRHPRYSCNILDACHEPEWMAKRRERSSVMMKRKK